MIDLGVCNFLPGNDFDDDDTVPKTAAEMKDWIPEDD